MKLNNNSSYSQRMLYAEIAKFKEKYLEQNYHVNEDFEFEYEEQKINYDLMIENAEKIIFFEFKTGNIGNEGQAILERKVKTLKQYPNAEFRLVVIQQSETKKSKIEHLQRFLDKILQIDFENLKKGYSNCTGISNIEEYNLNYFELRADGLVLEGYSYAKCKFEVNSDEFKGTLIDTIPFKFELQFKNYLEFIAFGIPYLIFEPNSEEIIRLIKRNELKYKIDYAFSKYK